MEVGEGCVVYEAHEVKKGGGKLRCLLLRRKNKNIFYICMKSLLGNKIQNGPYPLLSCDSQALIII